MLDTMTFTKIVGGFCGTLLIFLLGNWAAETIYHVGDEGHGEHAQAYAIDTGEDHGGAEEEAAPAIPFEEVFASADAGKGEGLFRACGACHKLEDGANATGPYLFGVVGRDIASAGGFGYSEGLSALEGNWTPEALSGFLENPKAYAPGNKMSYRGMADVEDRANLIAYLATIGG